MLSDPHDLMRGWYALFSVLNLILVIALTWRAAAQRRSRGVPPSNRWGFVVLGAVLLLGTSAYSGVVALLDDLPANHRVIWLTAANTFLLTGLIGVLFDRKQRR